MFLVPFNRLFSFAVTPPNKIFNCGYSAKQDFHLRLLRQKQDFRVRQLTFSATLMIRLGFKGIVVNRVLSSLHGGSLEITLTVLLRLLNSCWISGSIQAERSRIVRIQDLNSNMAALGQLTTLTTLLSTSRRYLLCTTRRYLLSISSCICCLH